MKVSICIVLLGLCIPLFLRDAPEGVLFFSQVTQPGGAGTKKVCLAMNHQSDQTPEIRTYLRYPQLVVSPLGLGEPGSVR